MQTLTQAEGALAPTLSSPNRLDAGWSQAENEAAHPAPGYFALDLLDLALELRKKVPLPLPAGIAVRAGTAARPSGAPRFSLLIRMHPRVRRDLLCLGQPDHVNRRGVTALPTCSARIFAPMILPPKVTSRFLVLMAGDYSRHRDRAMPLGLGDKSPPATPVIHAAARLA